MARRSGKSTIEMASKPRAGPINAAGTGSSKSAKPSFPLRKLPLELRQNIYRNVVVATVPIRFISRLTKHKDGSASLCAFDSYKISISILLVNRETYKEAIEIFYGENVFSAFNPKCLKFFMELVGSRKVLVRHMKIEYALCRATTRSALHQLKGATALRTLTVSEGRHGRTPENVAGDYRPWLKALRKGYSANNIAGNVLDVLRISSAQSGMQLDETADDIQKEDAEYRARVRAALEKFLA